MMIIQCAKCQKKYKIDAEKVTEKGVKVTCQNCGNVLLVRKRAEDAQKESTPCSVCGHPATQKLDTDAPLCDRCFDIEQETAARFVEFTKPKAGPASSERELDLTDGEKVSFDSISGGDFAPDAYSTGVLPGEGKGYVPPERVPLKSVVGPDEPVNFEEFSHGQTQDNAPPSTSRLGGDQAGAKSPPSPPKPPAVPAPGTKPSPAGAPPRDVTPPPRPSPKSATPPPGSTVKPSPGGVSVKDATPPPRQVTPIPKPARPAEPTPPPTPDGGKKTPPKAEAITLEPVEGTDAESVPVTPVAEVTSLDVPGAQETPKRASVLPFILSVLLLLALLLYFFVKFADTSSL